MIEGSATRWATLTFIVLLLGTRPGRALDRNGLRFYVSFENGFAPDIAQGDVEVAFAKGSEKDLRFERGVRGRGVVLDENVSLTYRGKEIFSQKEGTISFWLKAVGWKAGDGRNHYFLTAHSDTCSMMLYRFWPGNNWVYVSGGGRNYVVGGGQWWDGWNKDVWAHLAFTFKPSEQAWYINGKCGGTKSSDLLEPQFAKRGSLRLHEGFGAGQVVDEVMIFNRALAGPEIAALAAVTKPGASQVTAPPMSAPKVDGTVSRVDEWQRSVAVTGWADRFLAAANSDASVVKIGHSPAALYCLFSVPVDEKFKRQRDLYVGSDLKTTAKQRDGDITADDYVGVFVSPPGADDVYFFGVNGAQAKRDEKNGDASWNSEWSVDQTWTDNVWTVEFSIPRTIFGGDPLADSDWGINFVHGGRQLGLVESIWHYQPGTLRPLASLRLSSLPVCCELRSLGDLSNGELAVVAAVANRSDKSLEARESVSVVAGDKTVIGPETRQLMVGAGQADETLIESSIAQPLAGAVRMQIVDAAGTILLEHGLPFVFSRDLNLELQYYATPESL